MKTRFTPLVIIKKNSMDTSERELQRANADVTRAQKALDEALATLNMLELPFSGSVSDLLQGRTLIESARAFVDKNREWLLFAQTQRDFAQTALKETMMEFEKFKYLEAQEIQAALKKEKLAQAKELDEIAGQAFFRNKEVL